MYVQWNILALKKEILSTWMGTILSEIKTNRKRQVLCDFTQMWNS